MFTGIIEAMGILTSRSGGRLKIRSGKIFPDLQLGESIAVNGCCLTLEEAANDGTLTFFTLDETLRCTVLGERPLGARVNLERALAAGGRLGGHFVSGHVDGKSSLLNRVKCGNDEEFTFELPAAFRQEVILKGSVALDGVSLTVQNLTLDSFSVRLIPTTLHETALGDRKIGESVNLETDLIGKYVRAILTQEKQGCSVTMGHLRSAGFL